MLQNNYLVKYIDHAIIWFLPAILLIIAPLLTLPYGFYNFLRLVVTIACILIVYRNIRLKLKFDIFIFVFVLLAILFNPIAPIKLSKEIWMPIDFISSAIFIFHYFKRR